MRYHIFCQIEWASIVKITDSTVRWFRKIIAY